MLLDDTNHSLDLLKLKSPPMMRSKCRLCGKEFENKASNFCSLECAEKYAEMVSDFR